MAIAPVKTVLLNFIFVNVVHYVPHRLNLMYVSGCKSKAFERLVIKGIYKGGINVNGLVCLRFNSSRFNVCAVKGSLGGYIPKRIFRGSTNVNWLGAILQKR